MIRQFRPEDAWVCSAIIASCIQVDRFLNENLRAILLRTEAPERMMERSRLFHVVVSETGSAIYGFGGLELNEIRILYVAPEYHRKRVGSEILRHLESLVPPALFSDIFVYAAPGAVGFYQTHGYRSKGDYYFDIEGESLPTVFMTRPIPS
jgi:GNAT superfamily N-acetyltransferase